LEVLFPEKTSALIALIAGERESSHGQTEANPGQAHFGSTVPGKNSAFWKYCSRKKQRILEVLFPEKTSALIAGERSRRSRWPNFTFFFRG
jgi:hypothetical protein